MKRNPKSRRGLTQGSLAIFRIVLFVALFLAFPALSPIFSEETVKTTPEQKIKETLTLLSKGYEKENVELTMSAYSKAYAGVHEETLSDVEKRIQDIFSALQSIKFNFTKMDVTVDNDKAVVLCDYRIIANAGAKKIYQRFKVKFSFILENEDWKIIREEVLALPGFTPGM